MILLPINPTESIGDFKKLEILLRPEEVMRLNALQASLPADWFYAHVDAVKSDAPLTVAELFYVAAMEGMQSYERFVPKKDTPHE